MTRNITKLLLALFLVGCSHPPSEKSREEYHETPHDFMFMQRAYPTGEIDTEAYSEAVAWKKEQLQRSSNGPLWEFVGPTNIGGR
ncbi:MAG: hypothetical protein AAFP76_08745, partial [Bacteroidota bacterium]